MASAALKLTMPPDEAFLMANEPLESRVARIEADVSQINTRLGNVEVDLRDLRTSMDHKFEHLESKIDQKFSTLAKWGLTVVLTLFSAGAVLGGVILNAVLRHGH